MQWSQLSGMAGTRSKSANDCNRCGAGRTDSVAQRREDLAVYRNTMYRDRLHRLAVARQQFKYEEHRRHRESNLPTSRRWKNLALHRNTLWRQLMSGLATTGQQSKGQRHRRRGHSTLSTAQRWKDMALHRDTMQWNELHGMGTTR